MRTTLSLDNDLIAKTQAYTGVKEKAALGREALKALIQREAAKRLAKMRKPHCRDCRTRRLSLSQRLQRCLHALRWPAARALRAAAVMSLIQRHAHRVRAHLARLRQTEK